MKKVSISFLSVGEWLLWVVFLGMGTYAFSMPIYLAQSPEKKVEFLAVGYPSALKIRGKLKQANALDGVLKVENGRLFGTASLQLNALETGIGLRDRHMREKYLETHKFPTAVLKLEPIALGDRASKTTFSWEGPFQGLLNLHGVKKPVSGQAKLKRAGLNWSGEFSFGLELADFAIEVPSYLGITVSKSVKVHVAFQQ